MANVKVTTAGVDCKVVEHKDDLIKCVTGHGSKSKQIGDVFPGSETFTFS